MSLSLPRWPSVGAVALALLACTSPARAQNPRPGADSAQVAADTLAPARPDSAAVVLRGDTLTWLYGPLGPFSPAERADAVSRRLTNMRGQGVDSAQVRVEVEAGHTEVWVGDVVLATVTPADSVARGSARAAADSIAAAARVGLKGSLFTRNVRDILVGLLETLLTTLALYLLMRLMAREYPRLYDRIRRLQEEKLQAIRFQRLELVSGDRIAAGLLTAARASRLLVSALLLFIYFPLVFSFFPPTRVWAQRIFALALEPTRAALVAVAGYLPNLFYIAVILVFTYYGLKIIHVVFQAVEQGTIHLPGFYDDWAEPTFKIIRALALAFAVILVWPYLPNSGSDAFKGVAAFLGLLLTFGSAGAVSNVVGGVVMIYMRPFQLGDRVRIADTVGDVIERGMLVTRVRTPKNVEITIPNSMVLGSHIVNYSATARQTGVILHTTLTIGYDAPWQKVHEVMKEAARRTEGILEKPEPFVLQTALGDYAISYELNAYTSEPNKMAGLYSGLHQNLQDTFAESGIEILSPVYHALRDGNPSTLPLPYGSGKDGAPDGA
jgi:small-conductance mechanosensitive channel